MMTGSLYYKYRNLDNFRNFVDIILKNRLYTAKYKDLNDPMEGLYYYQKGKLNRDIRDKLLKEKEGLRLCSLSKVKDNQLMWSHYTNGQRGVAIGLRIDDTRYTVRTIQYNGLAYIQNHDFNNQTAIEILSHKLEVWNYEEEVRVFERNEYFIDVRIEEVITGVAMSNADFDFVKKLIKRINPEIKIIKAKTFMNN
ncbi:hypothetical protein EZS27_024957 [termite gut metagenome]|uniref:DUF2971 domain-containing protein n=1 Tax=termite gut metagenome TaxID=433724 RepID=A0A5J4QX11_9ZZZZ